MSTFQIKPSIKRDWTKINQISLQSLHTNRIKQLQIGIINIQINENCNITDWFKLSRQYVRAKRCSGRKLYKNYVKLYILVAIIDFLKINLQVNITGHLNVKMRQCDGKTALVTEGINFTNSLNNLLGLGYTILW